ncbi:MAG: protein kinase [Alphaproteobacteria bacterium]|nr:protein kinase [Alphaproteobacteria bacterium]
MRSPLLPTRFGRYELVDLLATGGMAEVFLARSFGVQGFQKHVVIKRLRPGLARSPRFVQLFIQEARLSASLVHPNVVQIHELGAVPTEGGDLHYIAMEYIHGHDLTHLRRALAAEERTLDPGLAVHAVTRVLRALAHAHDPPLYPVAADDETASVPGRVSIVHRDVSPHNVLVSFQGDVKLVDFGIARVEGELAGSAAGLPGGGKYAYMSPEQALGQPVDGRSDVFSAGIVLWELLAGRRLFQHPDPVEKLRRVQQAEVPDVRTVARGVPDGLWRVLQAMLQPSPQDRPTAAAAEQALQEVRYEAGLRGDAVALGRVLRQCFPERARRDPGGLDLSGLAADLAALEPADSGATPAGASGDTATHSSMTHTPSAVAHSALPRLHRLAPGERRAVVVLVGEISGLTDPSASHDPERIVRAHYRLLRRVRRVVDRHEGLLERFQDDAFTVFFGLPLSTEHDVDRALACAAQLVRLGQRLPQLSMSIGVHTGEVAMGRVDPRGSGRRLRYLARGDTTKLAARLAAAAELDDVLVSERVARLAGQRFRFAPGPELRQRRGGAAAARRLVGRETGVRATAGRWLRREDELDQLGLALRRVAGGERVVVAIRGEAGTGKSRLVQELRDLARARGVSVYSARAVPYAADRPLATLRDVVARALGLPLDPSLETVERALERLRALGLGEADTAGIGFLFGREAPGLVEGEARAERVAGGLPAVRAELLGAAGRFVRALAGVGPVLLAIEDAQHLSALERLLLAGMVDETAGVPVLLLTSTRGELPPELTPVDVDIVLGPLSAAQQDAVLRQTLGASAIDERLATLVAASTQGNARYLDEIVQALRAADAIAVEGGRAGLRDGAEVGLPDRLEHLIGARVDALEPTARQVLQLAAVMGQGFSVPVLREACGGADVDPVLRELHAKGLLQVDDDRGGFANQLVWEVVEGRLLATRRRELHDLVAAAIIARHGDRDGPHLSGLAAHAAAAGRPLDAARHATAAGDSLHRQQLLAPALRQWEQALVWLQQAQVDGAGTDACLSGEAVLHWRLGHVRTLLGEPRRAERHLRAAQDAAAECEDSEIEARAALDLGRLYRDRGKAKRARVMFESALLATGGGGGGWRRAVAVEALEALGALLSEGGDEHGASQRLAQALERAGDDDALSARALLGLAAQRIRLGQPEDALSLLADAGERAGRSGDRILVGRVINQTGRVHKAAGRLSQALDCFERSRQLRRDTGYRQGEIVTLHAMGDTLAAMGEDARAWAAFEHSRELAERSGWRRGVVMNEIWLRWLEARRQGPGAPVDDLVDAIERAVSLGDAGTARTGRSLLSRLQPDAGAAG